MSPEQARGETATERSDIYALGVVLFEMLAGRRPFEGDSAAAIAMARLTPPVPMPSVYRAGIPPVLEAICRKAMAIEPGERFHSAQAMADALDDELADRAGSPGRSAGAVAAAAAAATVAAGVARANPPIPYAPDAYVGSGATPPPPSASTATTADDGGGPGPWAWIAGLLGLGILLAVGFLVFRLLTGGSTPPPSQVVVPNFVGQTVDTATQLAEAKGLKLVPQFVKSNDQPEGTITNQDPPANTTVDVRSVDHDHRDLGPGGGGRAGPPGQDGGRGGHGAGPGEPGPGHRGRLLRSDRPGGRRSSPASPVAGTQVTTGTTVDYVVSKGPEPTATPSPTPSPTAAPTPSPTPSPTPTAALTNVGEYRCQTLAARRPRSPEMASSSAR